MDQSQEQLKTEEQSAKNITKQISWIIILIFLAGVIYSLYIWGNRNDGTPPTKQEVTNQQIQQFEQELNGLHNDSAKEQFYSYWLRLARAEYQLGNYQKALDWLNRFSADDIYQGVWYTRALIQKSLGENEPALDSVKQEVELFASNPQSWLLYFELIKNKPTQEQEAVYQKALIATEQDTEVVNAYANFKSGVAE